MIWKNDRSITKKNKIYITNYKYVRNLQLMFNRYKIIKKKLFIST